MCLLINNLFTMKKDDVIITFGNMCVVRYLKVGVSKQPTAADLCSPDTKFATNVYVEGLNLL